MSADAISSISENKTEAILKTLEHFQNQQKHIHVVRPKIKAGKILFLKFFFIFILVILYAVLFFFIPFFKGSVLKSIFIPISILIAIEIIFSKKIIITDILLYQYFAPEKLRASCRFEPTCSNYAIQAVEKYGVLKGVKKSVNRLFRCKYPNGGIDLP